MKNQKKKGFTLIELLVVIAIIGLLATLSVVALNNARERARDSRRVSDIKQIQTALELYYNAEDGYPEYGTDNNTAGGIIDLADHAAIQTDLEDFINPIPSAPQPNDGNCTNVVAFSGLTNGGNDYGYYSDGDSYEIFYCLGDGGPKTATPFTIGDL